MFTVGKPGGVRTHEGKPRKEGARAPFASTLGGVGIFLKFVLELKVLAKLSDL